MSIFNPSNPNVEAVKELKHANDQLKSHLGVLERTEASIAASEVHIKKQTGYTFWILLLTALIAGIDVYSHVFTR
jgi:hypothetical protein